MSCTVTLLSGKVTVLCPVESSPHLVICLSLDRDDHISDHSATSSVRMLDPIATRVNPARQFKCRYMSSAQFFARATSMIMRESK